MAARIDDLYAPEVIEAVGKIAIAASLLESSVVHLVRTLLRTDSTGAAIVTVETSFRWLSERCAALGRDRLDGPLLADLLAWLSSARTAMDQRNRVVHSTWFRSITIDLGQRGATAETGYRRTRTTKDGLTVDETPADPVALTEIAETIQGRWNEANPLIVRITEALSDSLEARRPPTPISPDPPAPTA